MVLRLLLLLCLSACYFRAVPLTPTVVSSSTYKVLTPIGGGTAFAVSKRFLVSAGHVCEMAGPFRAKSNYRSFTVTPVVWWDDDEGLRDVCVLRSDVDMDSWLTISSTMPKKGDKIGYVGFPRLEYGEFDGFYLGDVDGDETMNDDVITAPCDHGASGSPVYASGGVFGVLVRLRTDGGFLHDGIEGCVVTRLEFVREILNEAGVPGYAVP
jgi:hypothetical protein